MFEQILRHARQTKGMTQQALADQLFVSRKTVSSWETGRNLPNLETLARLAELLDVSTDYLLGRKVTTQKSVKLTGLPTVLAIVTIARFAIPTTVHVLWFSDAIILALLLLLVANYKTINRNGLRTVAVIMGVVLISSAWGQIFGMDFGNQIAYVTAGSLLLSESAWLICQDRFQLRSDLLKNKSWWIGNGIFGALVVSGVLWILVRQVDGSGHVEDQSSRLLALGVLGIFVVAVLLVELVVYLAINKSRDVRH